MRTCFQFLKAEPSNNTPMVQTTLLRQQKKALIKSAFFVCLFAFMQVQVRLVHLLEVLRQFPLRTMPQSGALNKKGLPK